MEARYIFYIIIIIIGSIYYFNRNKQIAKIGFPLAIFHIACVYMAMLSGFNIYIVSLIYLIIWIAGLVTYKININITLAIYALSIISFFGWIIIMVTH